MPDENRGRDPREVPDPDAWIFEAPATPPPATRRHGPRHLGAVLLILAGVLFFLNNAEVIHIGNIFTYSPLILVAVGISRLSSSRGLAHVWALVIAIGVMLLLHNLHLLSLNFRLLWPVGLIAIGFLFLIRRAELGVTCRRRLRREGNEHA